MFAIALVIGTLCLFGSNDNVVYAEIADAVSDVTPEGVDYIVEKHTDISDYRNKNADGYYTSPSIEKADTTTATNEWVFAGWYTSVECNDTLKKSVVSGEGYAKFVSADVLSVKCQISTDTQLTSPSTLLRCISSVDSLKYSMVGFDLITPAETKNMEGSTVGTRIQVSEDKASNPCNYSPKVVDTESTYFYSAIETIKGEDFANGFLVKPYWITKDGTKVYGVSKYVVIADALNKSAIYIPVKKSTEPTEGATFTVDGTSAEYKKYDADGGYVHLKYDVDSTTLGSVTKFQVTGGDSNTPVYYRNLNTKYTGSNPDQSWYTAYADSTEDEFVIVANADLYGLSVLANATNKNTFEGKTIYLCADIEANKGEATLEGWKATGEDGTSHTWTPIGTLNVSFNGTFDGQGHTISGIKVEDGYVAGLFAHAGANSVLQNFNLVNSYIGGTKYNGSVVGRVGGKISNVESSAIVQCSSYINGGIAGDDGDVDQTIVIEDCKFTGSIKSANLTGGIIGAFGKSNLEVKNCEVTNRIESSGQSVGGILGGEYNGDSTKTYNIENCQFTGAIEGNGPYVGGIVGLTNTGITNLKDNYFDGTLQVAKASGGGIVGCAYGTTDIDNCHSSATAYISNTDTASEAGGCVGRIKGTVSIKNSSFSGRLNAPTNVGGLAGYVDSTTKVTIENSYFAGTLNATSHYVGGILGRIDTICEIDITNCYSSGSVTSEGMNVGGIIGIINQAADVDMVNCLNKGTVSSSRDAVGGLVGRLASYSGINLDMRSCLNMGQVSGVAKVGSLIGWRQNGTVNAEDVYATKTSKATGDTDNIVVGSDATLDYAELVELEDITVSDTVSVDDIKTTLSGLFGTDTRWMIDNKVGSTPELRLK